MSLTRREAGATKLGTFVNWRPSEGIGVQGDVSLACTAKKILAQGDETAGRNSITQSKRKSQPKRKRTKSN